MWSKAQCVEEGEKNTKYFLNLEKRNFNAKHIKTLILPNGQLESKPENIRITGNFFINLCMQVLYPLIQAHTTSQVILRFQS